MINLILIGTTLFTAGICFTLFILLVIPKLKKWIGEHNMEEFDAGYKMGFEDAEKIIESKKNEN